MADSSPLIIEPRQARAADATVILLHGLGADGHDFEPLVPALPLAKDLAVRFVLPHAPRMPVTVNGGMEMPAWYDILDMNLGRRIDEAQLKASADMVHGLIDAEIGSNIATNIDILAEKGVMVGFGSVLNPVAELPFLKMMFIHVIN